MQIHTFYFYENIYQLIRNSEWDPSSGEPGLNIRTNETPRDRTRCPEK